MKQQIKQVTKQVHTLQSHVVDSDVVINEQPLQINLVFVANNNEVTPESLTYTVTMRTPGDEKAHIIGMLLSDSVITQLDDVVSITFEDNDDQPQNIWDVELVSECKKNIKALTKYQPTYSSCGLCGTTSLKSLELKELTPLSSKRNWLEKQLVFDAERLLFNEQILQRATGGAHCAALFDQQGNMIALKEDIGRHNALDKLIGQLALNAIPTKNACTYAVISSRVSFEMVQKILVAGIPVLIALGAPSALALQAAKRFNLTLIAFLKAETFNIYHGEWRLKN
ncbi:formate dehydrogenase accessory sulfurtransferase FdhD [Thalassotalea piscium]